MAHLSQEELHQLGLGHVGRNVRISRDARIYSPAKTVVDCFKHRNKIGLDVALEALKDAWRSRKVTMAELSYFAKINRVERVMQPYLEALVP